MNETEKKVEYLELIYDLIFVYIIGRNNLLLHTIENGFVPGRVFLAYILGMLAVIQIWNFTTYYINMFGRNGVRDHVFLFINMYLLYYIGEGTRVHWGSFHTQYHAAWALILINIGVQYLIERRNHMDSPGTRIATRNLPIVLFGEAALVLLAVPTAGWKFPVFSLLAILFGDAATWAFAHGKKANTVDFNHLSERAMLYVVFTFGEMIITIASYFEGSLTPSSIYFSLMAFLIVAALFLSYEMLYNHIIDRERETDGMDYMMIHVLLIFSMNCITTALEFMRDERVNLLPKTTFLTAAFLFFYVCLFALMRYERKQMGVSRKFILPLAGAAAVFAAAMILLRRQMYLNIALSVVFVYFMFLRLYQFQKKSRQSR